jgi:O-antigen/teichoic acid export membrane protein
MDIFIAINCLIVLFLSVNLDWIAKVYINNPEYYEGIGILPILFFASLFLGIYLNLSIWYKLTDKTIIGAYISGIGVLITILINFYLFQNMVTGLRLGQPLRVTFHDGYIVHLGTFQISNSLQYLQKSDCHSITMLVSLVCYQYLKENIWLGNVIFLILATFLLKRKN